MLDFIVVRSVFAVLFVAATVYFRPAPVGAPMATAVGCGAAILVMLFERRFESMTLGRVIGMTLGLLSGLLCSALTIYAIAQIGTRPLGTDIGVIGSLEIVTLLVFAYCGAAIGAHKGTLLRLDAFGIFGAETGAREDHKILDTSVIIDGRVADIAETGFLDGVVVIPQFVLHELQMVADSQDSLKRTRGRRGLDILQRIQKIPRIRVQIVDEDFPRIREVDMKLIELASLYKCRIVTNDFNLNKVAHVRGVEVLNINELANAMRPVVLPGETMRVFILKEGKEHTQGVAYLDDGTMVVVDNARRMISKTIDITVTSVLQTTAGKMIFGKFDERVNGGSHPHGSQPQTSQTSGDRRREQAAGEA